jgi:hypothetical protein
MSPPRLTELSEDEKPTVCFMLDEIEDEIEDDYVDQQYQYYEC